MTKRRKIVVVGGFLLLLQFIYFSDYISPVQWGSLKVRGLACTCPDETVVRGNTYLRMITPDSLKKYNLDYSEIYVTEQPTTDIDPMGVDEYIIEGEVIGKARVYEGDSWNPKFRVDKWRAVNIYKDWTVKLFLFVQLVVWGIFIWGARGKRVENGDV